MSSYAYAKESRMYRYILNKDRHTINQKVAIMVQWLKSCFRGSKLSRSKFHPHCYVGFNDDVSIWNTFYHRFVGWIEYKDIISQEFIFHFLEETRYYLRLLNCGCKFSISPSWTYIFAWMPHLSSSSTNVKYVDDNGKCCW